MLQCVQNACLGCVAVSHNFFFCFSRGADLSHLSAVQRDNVNRSKPTAVSLTVTKYQSTVCSAASLECIPGMHGCSVLTVPSSALLFSVSEPRRRQSHARGCIDKPVVQPTGMHGSARAVCQSLLLRRISIIIPASTLFSRRHFDADEMAYMGVVPRWPLLQKPEAMTFSSEGTTPH